MRSKFNKFEPVQRCDVALYKGGQFPVCGCGGRGQVQRWSLYGEVKCIMDDDHLMNRMTDRHNVTGPPGALSFDVKPEIAQEKSQ